MALINLPIVLNEIFRFSKQYRYIIHPPGKREKNIVNLQNIFVNKFKIIILIIKILIFHSVSTAFLKRIKMRMITFTGVVKQNFLTDVCKCF